jgi:RNA-binding protein
MSEAMLSNREKKELKTQAHHLKPLVQVGKKGVTDQLVDAVDSALVDHELVKVRFLEYKDERKSLAESIASRTESEIVTVIGNIAILYRKKREERSGTFSK